MSSFRRNSPVRRFIIGMALRRVIAAHKTTLATRKLERTLAADKAHTIVNAWRRSLVERSMAPDARPDRTQPRTPGRQRIYMPATVQGLFGTAPAWFPLPKLAREAPWEDLHTFPKGERAKRDPHFGLIGSQAAISMICVACDLEQPPILTTTRDCPYCGLRYTVKGTHVFWWREDTPVPEWKP